MAAHEYRDLVEQAGMCRSRSRKGCPLANATVESFLHTLTAELVHQRRFVNEIDAVARVAEYIDLYNRDGSTQGSDTKARSVMSRRVPESVHLGGSR